MSIGKEDVKHVYKEYEEENEDKQEIPMDDNTVKKTMQFEIDALEYENTRLRRKVQDLGIIAVYFIGVLVGMAIAALLLSDSKEAQNGKVS